MNNIHPLRPTALDPLVPLFAAWRVIDDRQAHPERIHGTSLAEIERQIACEGNYGATVLLIEQSSVTESKRLHAYRIRRGKWLGATDRAGCKVYPYAADKLFSVPIDAFAPTKPWQWIGDSLGLGNVVEGVRL